MLSCTESAKYVGSRDVSYPLVEGYMYFYHEELTKTFDHMLSCKSPEVPLGDGVLEAEHLPMVAIASMNTPCLVGEASSTASFSPKNVVAAQFNSGGFRTTFRSSTDHVMLDHVTASESQQNSFSTGLNFCTIFIQILMKGLIF